MAPPTARPVGWRSESRGFRRTRAGYDDRPATPKRVFVRALIGNAGARPCARVLAPPYHHFLMTDNFKPSASRLIAQEG